jgi:hypothetical protein
VFARVCIVVHHHRHHHVQDLLTTIRTQVLLKLLRPYTRINIAYLGRTRR